MNFNGYEATAIAVVSKVSPWLTPIPTAWLVYDRTMLHLHWPRWVAICAGVTLELLGVAILSTSRIRWLRYGWPLSWSPCTS